MKPYIPTSKPYYTYSTIYKLCGLNIRYYDIIIETLCYPMFIHNYYIVANGYMEIDGNYLSFSVIDTELICHCGTDYNYRHI